MFVLISFTKNSLSEETNCKYFRFNQVLEPLIITTILRLLISLIFFQTCYQLALVILRKFYLNHNVVFHLLNYSKEFLSSCMPINSLGGLMN